MLAVVPPTRHLFPLLSALLLTAALAGCVGSDDEVDPSTTPDVYPGCEDAVMATIVEGGAMVLGNGTIQQPLTLCITNEDTAPHGFQAMPSKPPKPEFVPLPTVVDPHAEHRGGAAPVVEISIQPGETLVLGDIAFHGILMFMEVGNMDNNVVFEILPEGPATYPVIENQVVMTGSDSGQTDAGQTGTVTFDVAVPDLEKIQLALTWDDSADDGDGGQNANQADTLEVRLLDPSGTEVAKKTTEAREGEIKIDHKLEIPAFPETVTAEGMTNATTQLATERAPDLSRAGTWKVEVAVVEAPGLLPDTDGSTKALPVGDGQQAWDLKITTVHRWASVGFVGTEGSPDIVQAAL